VEIVGIKDFYEIRKDGKIILRFLGYDAPDIECEDFSEPFNFWSACDYYFGSNLEERFPQKVDEIIREANSQAFLAEITAFDETINVQLAKLMFDAIAERFGSTGAVYLEFEDNPVLSRAAVLAGFNYFCQVSADGNEEGIGDFVGTINMIFKKPFDKAKRLNILPFDKY
jgi:predicted DNA binding CopG/RHH family protein